MTISLNSIFQRREYDAPVVMGDEKIMSKKAHGTSAVPVQDSLRWKCDKETADRICNYNRHYAEHGGYFLLKQRNFTSSAKKEFEKNGELVFYDSNTGKPLFRFHGGKRTFDEFIAESRAHGWPSFRDEEVDWTNVRILKGGEAVSVDGTHLGHNLPDRNGNRYCINLVSCAGHPDK
uniref:Uncharacterized protein n=1 Tax=Minutocellus polymorphus TaxID=265543 RepID=A0A7S0AIL1_9STRA|mmetsp:Transcript_14953/g.24919  ORF Transcript_14953/g.24919 Transcript_14953/m.24919 type:complete len:177 (+) Transcript_14953:197-727(+)